MIIKDIGELNEPICCVIQLLTQMQGVLHQVVLDPEKVKVEGEHTLIRIGEWPGDEARGWVLLPYMQVVCVLGSAKKDGQTVTVTPIIEQKGVS